MALIRCVTEMGMGVDVHGLDYTSAAKRAVFDAIHHSSLGFPRLVRVKGQACILTILPADSIALATAVQSRLLTDRTVQAGLPTGI
jgi:uncharacterized protein (TIGR02058 family)